MNQPCANCDGKGYIAWLNKSKVCIICNGSGIVSPVEQTETAFASQVGGDHYQGMSIQPALFITKNKIPFLEGCVIKRMCRHRLKNKAEDIRKAIQELRMILELEYGETEGGEKIQ